MTLMVFIYVYRIDMNIERLMPCSKKHNLHLINIISSNSKFKQQSTFRSKQQGTQVQCPVQSDLQLSLSCFYWCFYLTFCIFRVFFFVLNSYLVYCYVSSTHCIYVFTFNSDILSFGKWNISIDSWLTVRFYSSATRKRRRYSEGKTMSLSI